MSWFLKLIQSPLTGDIVCYVMDLSSFRNMGVFVTHVVKNTLSF